MSSLGQLLNGHGNSFGKVKAEPHGSEDDQQSHNGQGDEMDSLNRLLKQFELLEFVKPAREFVEPVDEISGMNFCVTTSPTTALDSVLENMGTMPLTSWPCEDVWISWASVPFQTLSQGIGPGP